MARRPPLHRPEAREVERLTGLDHRSLTGVERRANGDYALRFRSQAISGRCLYAIRIPKGQIEGYRPRSTATRPQGMRTRRIASERRFWLWLGTAFDSSAPAVRSGSDLNRVRELRVLIQMLAAPSVADQAEAWLWLITLGGGL